MVVRLAQVGKHQHLGRAIGVFRNKPRRRRFERWPWRLITRCLTCQGYGPRFEHVQIVIRLEDEALAVFHFLLNDFMNIPLIGW